MSGTINKTKGGNHWILWTALPLVGLVWLSNLGIILFWDTVCHWFPEAVNIEPGTFGDTFGAVNALFSALAFALLIWTAEMQREELKQNTDMLRKQADEMEGQSQAMRNQYL